jgi:hypothetical protein
MSSVELEKAAGCVACRFIWENIEESLGTNQKNSILAAEAFQYYCKISPDIFYQPCNDMFEQLYDMSEKFAKGEKIDTICAESNLCDQDYLNNLDKNCKEEDR